MMNASKSSKKKGSAPPVKKVLNKAGPHEALKSILLKDDVLGEYIRIFVGTASNTKREAIFHHPVGITTLQDDEWVMSDVSDIPLLIQRRGDPYVGQISDARSKWIDQEIIKKNLLEVQPDGTVLYAKSREDRTAFLTALKEQWKTANPKAKVSNYDQKDALMKSGNRAALEEQVIRREKEVLGKQADLLFKSAYETKGGTKQDHPQVAVKWLKGMSTNDAIDALIKGALDGPNAFSSADSVGYSPDTMEIPSMIQGPTPGAQKQQWCFLPRDLDKKTKADVKAALMKVKADLAVATGSDEFTFSVAHKK